MPRIKEAKFTNRNAALKIHGNEHNPPHCHLYVGGFKATIIIRTLEVIFNDGVSKPDMQEALAWMKGKTDLLLNKWDEWHAPRN